MPEGAEVQNEHGITSLVEEGRAALGVGWEVQGETGSNMCSGSDGGGGARHDVGALQVHADG